MSVCFFRCLSSSADISELDSPPHESDADEGGASPKSMQYGVKDPIYGNIDERDGRKRVALYWVLTRCRRSISDRVPIDPLKPRVSLEVLHSGTLRGIEYDHLHYEMWRQRQGKLWLDS